MKSDEVWTVMKHYFTWPISFIQNAVVTLRRNRINAGNCWLIVFLKEPTKILNLEQHSSGNMWVVY